MQVYEHGVTVCPLTLPRKLSFPAACMTKCIVQESLRRFQASPLTHTLRLCHAGQMQRAGIVAGE